MWFALGILLALVIAQFFSYYKERETAPKEVSRPLKWSFILNVVALLIGFFVAWDSESLSTENHELLKDVTRLSQNQTEKTLEIAQLEKQSLDTAAKIIDKQDKLIDAQGELIDAQREARDKVRALMAFIDLHLVLGDYKSRLENPLFEDVETRQVQQSFTELNQKLMRAIQILKKADPQYANYEESVISISKTIVVLLGEYIKYLEGFKTYDPANPTRYIMGREYFRNNFENQVNFARELEKLYEIFTTSIRP
jgi:hypothetical protein